MSGSRRAMMVLAAAVTLACLPGAAMPEAAAQMKTGGEFPASLYYPNRTQAHRAMEGKPAPALEISEWIGSPAKLGDLKGKVVVVDFWATWCGPCMRALPHNVELMSKHGKDGLMVIGVHDSARGWEKAAQTVKSNKINYPVGRDAGTSATAWNVAFWPTYAVIDRKGVVRAAGLLPTGVDAVVEKLLAEPGPDKPDDKKSLLSESLDDHGIPADWLEGTSSARKQYAPLMAMDAPPEITADSWLHSMPQRLSDLRGKVVLVHFWSPRREASVKVMKDLQKVYATLADQGLEIVAIAPPEAKDKWAQVVGEGRLRFPVALDESKSTINAYHVTDYPESFLIDRTGKLRAADVKEAKLEAAIKLLLAEAAPE